ncbi:unnamed protein product, partial [Ectocarpus sp. 13 AM-2016]
DFSDPPRDRSGSISKSAVFMATDVASATVCPPSFSASSPACSARRASRPPAWRPPGARHRLYSHRPLRSRRPLAERPPGGDCCTLGQARGISRLRNRQCTCPCPL